MNACALFFCIAAAASVISAKDKSPSDGTFDVLILNIQANGCRYSIAVNGESSEHLSGDAMASAMASVPLAPDELKRKNELRIETSDVADDAFLEINIEGMNIDEERVMSSNEEGNILSLRMKGDEVKAAAGKARKVSFEAPLSGKYQMPTDEEVFAYAEQLVGMFVDEDVNRIAAELLYSSKKDERYKGQSDEEIIESIEQEMAAGFANVNVRKVDSDDLFIVPMFGGLKHRLMAVDGNGKVDLIRFAFPDDPDATNGLRVTVVKVNGRIVIDAMR